MSAKKQEYIINLMIKMAKEKGQTLTVGQVGRRLNKLNRRIG